MRILLLSVIAFFWGFLSAIPIGSVQLEVIKRALHGKLKSAFAMIVGALVSDLIYGFAAFFGLLPFLRNGSVMGIFEFISSMMLLVLSYFTIKNRNKVYLGGVQHFIIKSKRMSFLIGLSLGITNPVIIFWWLLCANVIGDIGLFQVFSKKLAFVTVVFGAIGLVSYLSILAFIISRSKKFISHATLAKINLILGILLGGLSLYFFITSAKYFWGIIK